MIRSIFWFSLLFAVSAAGSERAEAQLDSLAWLAGCWQGSYGNGRTVTEQWMQPMGNTMIGMSRTVRGGKTIAYEYIRLEQSVDRTIRYIALPSKQPEASFTLISMNATMAVFENPNHDFPQRIIYRLVTVDSLVARIEGRINGKERSSDFPYRRTRCESIEKP